MKIKHVLLFVFALCITATQAQTADEIIAKYIENTGGYDKWAKVESMRYSTKLNQGGMELPFVLIQMKDVRQGQIITFQGKEIKQGMFDGTNLWSSNPLADKTERSDAESTENLKANLGADFPIAFFDYKKRGYKVEFMGKETVEGTETFKIKLTKNPVKQDGKPKESVAYYFFDTENYIPLLSEEEITSGPGKGMIAISKFSDYQEVDGLTLAFSMAAGVKGQPTQTINFTTIEVNPTIDPSIFVMPAQK